MVSAQAVVNGYTRAVSDGVVAKVRQPADVCRGTRAVTDDEPAAREPQGRGTDTRLRNAYMGTQNCLRQEWDGTSGWDQFTLPTHDFLHQTDLEHGQAASGIVFNIRWNFDWRTDTSSCYHVQDYKRASSWNIEHGFVET